jgi:biopolymer transport protein TolR
MTKRQVRARMRRMREQFEEAEEDTGEINLVPYMDIVTNIIIFLLASVINQVPLGTVNVSSPTFGAGGAGDSQPEKPALNLTVTVGGTGFTLAGSGGVMPPIPKLPNGDYDYPALTTKLAEIKKEFSDETKATFNADAVTPYDTVVKTLDAMRYYKDEKEQREKELFPDVVFAAGIL